LINSSINIWRWRAAVKASAAGQKFIENAVEFVGLVHHQPMAGAVHFANGHIGKLHVKR